MSEPRLFQITFHGERSTYELALDFTVHVHAIVELSETERYYFRDTLDRKATTLAMSLSRATNLPLAHDRRAACERVLPVARECSAMLDILAARQTVPADILEPARTVLRVLIGRIEGLAN